jgi:hypothetical protein
LRPRPSAAPAPRGKKRETLENLTLPVKKTGKPPFSGQTAKKWLACGMKGQHSDTLGQNQGTPKISK